jgi:hypothetical protein
MGRPDKPVGQNKSHQVNAGEDKLGLICTNLHFVVTSTRTLYGPFILMSRLVDNTLCLDQLYSCTVIMLSSLCTPVRHFVVTSAHTLIGLICCTTWKDLHTLVISYANWCYAMTINTCVARTLLGSVVLLYFNPVSVRSRTVYTTALYNCELASDSLASVLSTNHRRASIYLLCSDWSIKCPCLYCCMLTQPFCPAERAGRIVLCSRGLK